MKYMTGNIMDLIGRPDAICITTNGFVTSRREAVMSMGIAKAMSDRFPGLTGKLARLIAANGNVVNYLGEENGTKLLSFPVKPVSIICSNPELEVVSHARSKYIAGSKVPGFHCAADTEIIRKSCEQLMYLMDRSGIKHCVIPIPGCGAGELSYQQQVKQICESHLDDRVWMCSFNESDFLK